MDSGHWHDDAASHEFDHSFRIDLRLDFGIRTATVVVSGDLDPASVGSFLDVMRTAVRAASRVVLSCERLKVFGSHASRAFEQALAAADAAGCDLVVYGLPRHVRQILDLVGVADHRLHDGSTRSQLELTDFDAILARGVLRGREAVMVLDGDLDRPHIVFVNAAFCEMSGYRADRVLGQSPVLLHGPLTDRVALGTLISEAKQHGEAAGEIVNYRADGTPYVVSFNLFQAQARGEIYWLVLQRELTDEQT